MYFFVYDNCKGESHMQDSFNPRKEYRNIKRYINEYMQEIKNINSSLQADPYNEDLLWMLQDKKHRKQLFEDDLKTIYF